MNYISIAETQMSSRPLKIIVDNLLVSADYAKYSPLTSSSNNQIPFFNNKSFSLTPIKKNLLNFYIFFSAHIPPCKIFQAV